MRYPSPHQPHPMRCTHRKFHYQHGKLCPSLPLGIWIPCTRRLPSRSLTARHWKMHAWKTTLQGTNISHLGKRKIIFKIPFWGDMLVPWKTTFLLGLRIFSGAMFVKLPGGIMLVVYPKKSWISRPLPGIGLMVSIHPQNRTMTIGEVPFLGHIWILRDSFARHDQKKHAIKWHKRNRRKISQDKVSQEKLR